MMRRLSGRVAPLGLGLVLAGSPASGEVPPGPLRLAGRLQCFVDPALGLGLGSARAVDCTYAFRDRHNQPLQERYAGTMTRVGIDVGLASGQTIRWLVNTPDGRSRPAMLGTAFRGPSGEFSAVTGPGTQSFLSEDGPPISLEPAGSSGQVGVGLGIGAARLELSLTAPASVARPGR